VNPSVSLSVQLVGVLPVFLSWLAGSVSAVFYVSVDLLEQLANILPG